MNLYQLGIAFTKVNVDILKLKSRIAVLEMIRIAGGRYTGSEVNNLTPYQQRRHRETISELERLGLIELDALGRPAVVNLPQQKIVNLPTYAPWTELSQAELKVYIALFVSSRHSRSPWFRFTGTHEELAEIARLNRKAVGTAIPALAGKALIDVRAVRDGKRWKEGTALQLNDPHSGASLNDLAWTFIRGIQHIPVLDKYKLALLDHDPIIKELRGFTSGYKVYCPSANTLRRGHYASASMRWMTNGSVRRVTNTATRQRFVLPAASRCSAPLCPIHPIRSKWPRT